MGWAYIYRMTSRYHTRVHLCMFTAGMLFGVIGGIGAIASSVLSSVFQRYPWISIVFSISALIGATITGVDDQLLKSTERASDCYQTHLKWLNIPRKIQIELKKQNVSMRIEGNIFSRNMEQDFAKTLNDSPSAPERYLKSWIRLREKYRKSGSRIGNASPIDVFSGEVPAYSSRRQPAGSTQPSAVPSPMLDSSMDSARLSELSAEGNIERFTGAPHEHVVTCISNEVPPGDKFNIELSLKKIKAEGRKRSDIKPTILSPYHFGLILDTQEYLSRRYPPAETV